MPTFLPSSDLDPVTAYARAVVAGTIPAGRWQLAACARHVADYEVSLRGEGEWVQLVVHLMDHIFALQQAAVRSGQSGVVKQLTQFQNACREVVRRVGLVPVEVKIGEFYNEKTHTLPEGHPPAPEGATITQVLATGYKFQGQTVRNALVVLSKSAEAATSEAPVPEPQAQPQLGFEEKLGGS